MSPTSTLLATKLQIPPRRPILVPRPHLIDHLDRGLRSGHILTLVCAPAGFGKTTLVTEWLRGLKHSIAWLSLDEGDNDPARFLTYLIAALRQIDAGIGETTEALLQSPQPSTPEMVLTSLINDVTAVSTPFILALDDYQTINTPAIHQQLTFVLEHSPPQMHLVILSREDPPLPIARRRARGQVGEIRQDDLRFTAEETAEFLQKVMGLDMSPDEIAALERRTEGWPAGLQLAALSMRGQADVQGFVQAFAGSDRYILDYLFEEVLRRQSSDVQNFLLQTSVLNQLSARLCDAVTGRTDSQTLLEALEHANLFVVPLDPSRTWYRYHHLFADLLHHQLRAQKEFAEALLRQRASQWYEANGFIIEALQHSLAAQDWDRSALLIGMASAQVIQHGQITTLSRWLEVVPDEIVRQRHEFALAKGWALMITGQFEMAETYADLAVRLMPVDAPPAYRGVVLSLRSYFPLARREVAATVELAMEALDLLKEGDPYMVRGAALNNLAQAQTMLGDISAAVQTLREMLSLSQGSQHALTQVSALSHLAELLNLQGQRQQALACARQALDQCVDTRGRPLPLAIVPHIVLGLLHYEANELARAHQHVTEALEPGTHVSSPGWVLAGQMMLARLQQALGQAETAASTLREVRQTAMRFKLPHLDAQIAAVEAEIQLRQGNLAAAASWAETAGLSSTDTPHHLRESEYVTYARLLLAQDKPAQAFTLLEKLEQSALAGGRNRSVIAIHILQALAHHALGREAKAHAGLGAALRLAAPENYVRAFLDEDPRLLKLLPKVRQLAPDFVDRVLQGDQDQAGPPAPAPADQALAESLSERELEVLRLIAAGLSNHEIADKLIIGVGTVKSHVHSILGKLDARDRTQAVARARELKLL